MKALELIDAYKHFHPYTRRYTLRRRNPVKHAHLNYFLISISLLDLVSDCTIKQGYKSDHSILELELVLNEFHRSKCVYRLINCQCLEDQTYLNLIRKVLNEEKIIYAILIYNLNTLENIENELIQLIIPDVLFLEMLLIGIRGESIRYATQVKPKKTQANSKK